MTPVTLQELRVSLVPAIEAVVPALHPEEEWAEIKTDPQGPQKRRFKLRHDAETLAIVVGDGEGVIGGGNAWEVEMLIGCSYAHEWIERDEEIIQSDGLDVWHALRDGAITGIVNVFPPSWQEEDTAEDGSVIGIHIFLVRFFAKDGSL